MKTYYESTVKFLIVDQSGYERKITTQMLVEAQSYTHAEARTIEIMIEESKKEFQIKNIKKSSITEVSDFGKGEDYFKCKIITTLIDEENGKDKKVPQYVLVLAEDTKDCLVELEKSLKYILMPYIISSVSLSKVTQVHYDSK